MIEFRLKALTARGEHIIHFLQQNELNLSCHCRPGESCVIEITEMPDERIDAIVCRPKPIKMPGEWRPYTLVKGMYGRRFDKGTSAQCIRDSLAAILGAGLLENSLAEYDFQPQTSWFQKRGASGLAGMRSPSAGA